MGQRSDVTVWCQQPSTSMRKKHKRVPDLGLTFLEISSYMCIHYMWHHLYKGIFIQVCIGH